MEKYSKRWLMSRLKTSGSKRRYLQNGSAAEERHVKRKLLFEELPSLEPIKATQKIYNGKLNLGPLVRFLRNKSGEDWDGVYGEIIARIPTALLDYKQIIFWFVADKVEFVDGRIWDRKQQKFIWNENLDETKTLKRNWLDCVFYEFYVDPSTNLLQHIQQKSFKNLVSCQ